MKLALPAPWSPKLPLGAQSQSGPRNSDGAPAPILVEVPKPAQGLPYWSTTAGLPAWTRPFAEGSKFHMLLLASVGRVYSSYRMPKVTVSVGRACHVSCA